VPTRFEIVGGNAPLPAAGEPVFIHFYSVQTRDVLRVPANALFADDYGGEFVRQVIDGQLERVYVVTGAVSDAYVEILEGLYEGNEVFIRP